MIKECPTAPVKAIVQQAIEEELSAYMFDNEFSNKDIDAVLRMFFDLIDRRYNKEGPYTMIFTSNMQPSQWKQLPRKGM